MINLLIILHIYFVSFLDKPEKSAPQLSERAKEQRAKWDIPTDQLDYPVSALYQNTLLKMGVKIHHKSRWFNGVTCEMDSATAVQVSELKFVTGVELTRDSTKTKPQKGKQRMDWMTQQDEQVTDNQLNLYNLTPLHEAGFEGQGILMAICDGGFGSVDTMRCFRQKELYLGHFDLTDDDEDFYDATKGVHGTACLSSISGIDSEQTYYGAATKAQYYLMRTEEYHTESPKEMDNFVAALEKADSLGVNIVSVSLGYSWFDNPDFSLPKSAMDGRSTRASLAATIAARKGMLVCAAAGNEGQKEWQIITVPGDADSILTVGAVKSDSVIAGFSSYGPSADGRVKPDVCATGYNTALINPTGQLFYSNGTSFATPLMAGLAACLWSAYPAENAMQIRDRIIRSADRYETPDKTRYGYGIPDAWKAYTMKHEEALLFETEHFNEDSAPKKIIRGDQILIIRHGHIYNLAGQRIE